jgi:hypothetical protein
MKSLESEDPELSLINLKQTNKPTDKKITHNPSSFREQEYFSQRHLIEFIDRDLERSDRLPMNNKNLDDFLTDRSAKVMKSIEEEIHKEVREGICEYFGIGDITELNEHQIDQLINAQENRDRGFLKLGYNLVIKKLHAR